MTTEWNASAYDRVADPQARWGAAVLDRLPLAGDETVLDAGCGTGRVTELLLGRLPRGRVVALDASASMLVEARGRLARFGERVEYAAALRTLRDGRRTGRIQLSAVRAELPAAVRSPPP